MAQTGSSISKAVIEPTVLDDKFDEAVIIEDKVDKEKFDKDKFKADKCIIDAGDNVQAPLLPMVPDRSCGDGAAGAAAAADAAEETLPIVPVETVQEVGEKKLAADWVDAVNAIRPRDDADDYIVPPPRLEVPSFAGAGIMVTPLPKKRKGARVVLQNTEAKAAPKCKAHAMGPDVLSPCSYNQVHREVSNLIRRQKAGDKTVKFGARVFSAIRLGLDCQRLVYLETPPNIHCDYLVYVIREKNATAFLTNSMKIGFDVVYNHDTLVALVKMIHSMPNTTKPALLRLICLAAGKTSCKLLKEEPFYSTLRVIVDRSLTLSWGVVGSKIKHQAFLQRFRVEMNFMGILASWGSVLQKNADLTSDEKFKELTAVCWSSKIGATAFGKIRTEALGKRTTLNPKKICKRIRESPDLMRKDVFDSCSARLSADCSNSDSATTKTAVDVLYFGAPLYKLGDVMPLGQQVQHTRDALAREMLVRVGALQMSQGERMWIKATGAALVEMRKPGYDIAEEWGGDIAAFNAGRQFVADLHEGENLTCSETVGLYTPSVVHAVRVLDASPCELAFLEACQKKHLDCWEGALVAWLQQHSARFQVEDHYPLADVLTTAYQNVESWAEDERNQYYGVSEKYKWAAQNIRSLVDGSGLNIPILPPGPFKTVMMEMSGQTHATIMVTITDLQSVLHNDETPDQDKVDELVLWSVLCDDEQKQMVVTLAGECNQKAGMGFFDDMFSSGPYAKDGTDVSQVQPIDNLCLETEKILGLIGDNEQSDDDVEEDSAPGAMAQSNVGAASSSAAVPKKRAGKATAEPAKKKAKVDDKGAAKTAAAKKAAAKKPAAKKTAGAASAKSDKLSDSDRRALLAQIPK